MLKHCVDVPQAYRAIQLLHARGAPFVCDIVECGLRDVEVHNIEGTSYISVPAVTHIANMDSSGANRVRRNVPLIAEDVIGLEWIQVYASRVRGHFYLRLGHSMTRGFPRQMFNHEIFRS